MNYCELPFNSAVNGGFKKMEKIVVKNHGFSLPLVLMILMILMIISAAILGLGAASIKSTQQQELKLQAYYLARSGVHAMAYYIIDNPDGLSDDEMNAYIEYVLHEGPSNSFKLDDDDQGDIYVSLSRPSEEILLVQATATVGNVSDTVSLNLIANMTQDTVFDKAVYSFGEMLIKASVNGDIAGFDEIVFDWGAIFDGDVFIAPDADPSVVFVPPDSHLIDEAQILNQESVPDFSMFTFPSFPVPPELSNVYSSVLSIPSAYTITDNIYYKEGITVDNGTLTIDRSENRVIRTKNLNVSGGGTIIDQGTEALNLFIENEFTIQANNSVILNLGDCDINIYTNELNFSPGKLVLNRPEGKTGIVNIFVNETLNLDNGGAINFTGKEMGESELVNIYYAGTNELQLSGGTNLSASLYVEKADIQLNSGHEFFGNLFSGGDQLEIYGGTSADVKLIYAPKAFVKITYGGKVTGVVVSNMFEISEGASMVFVQPDDEWIDPGDSSAHQTYQYGTWQ